MPPDTRRGPGVGTPGARKTISAAASIDPESSTEGARSQRSIFEVFELDAALDAPCTPMHRREDPDTSRDAAASLEPVLSTQRKQVYDALQALDDGRGVTAYQLAVTLEAQQSVMAKRCSELRDLGLVEDVGIRRPGSTSRLLIAWTAT